MNEEKITEAIVPIYCDGVFSGTGFIYRHYLITAEHVLRVYEGVYEKINGRCVKVARITRENNTIEYKYKGVYYSLKCSDAIYSKKKYGNGRVFYFIDEDIAIYSIPEGIRTFSMYDDIITDDFCASLYGFHCYSDNDIRIRNRKLKLSCTHTCMDLHPITQEKCCYGVTISEGERIIDGYSGGPVLNGNEIVGMFIGQLPDCDSYHFMKSSYILRKILEYEHHTKQNQIS